VPVQPLYEAGTNQSFRGNEPLLTGHGAKYSKTKVLDVKRVLTNVAFGAVGGSLPAASLLEDSKMDESNGVFGNKSPVTWVVGLSRASALMPARPIVSTLSNN
jgi:hypothetical protein